MFLGMRVGIPMQGAGGLWSPYSASLAALLAEASSSGLVLDFTRNIAFRSGTQSTVTGVSGWTYTRSGTAYDLAGTTSFGANVPRRTSAGLLVEAGATNLITRSQEYNDAAWTKDGGSITSTTATAPDGTSTACVFTENTASSPHRIYNSATVSSGATVTWSVFLAAGTRRFVAVGVGNGANYFSVRVDTQNWTLSAVQSVGTGAGTAATITPVSGGYRVSVTGAIPATTSYFCFVSGNSVSTGDIGESYVGTSATIIAWGAQLETGSTASSYIPTTTTSASRGADAASVNEAGFLAALAAGGTIITRFRRTTGGGNVWAFSAAGTLTFDYVQGNTSGNFRYGTSTPDLAQATADLSAVTAAMGYTAGGTHSLSINGATAVTSGVTTAPTATNLWLGRDDSGGNYLNNWLQLWAFLPRRASTSELAGASA